MSFLGDHGAEYPAIVASRTGLYVSLAERRCAFLEDAGYIESVGETAVYRLTDRGNARLAEDDADRNPFAGAGNRASD